MGLAIFRHLVRQLLNAPAARIPALRAEAVERLRRARDPLQYVQVLLDQCLANRSAGGLDFAIDILSQTGELALEFAQEFLREDARRWSTTPTIAHHPHDDYWFIILRSAARAKVNPMECLALIGTCLQAGNRGMREAVVEALYDLRTAEARQLLAQMAAQGPDPFIRQLAQDNLRDLEALEQ